MFNDKEQEILNYAKANGKTPLETKQAIARYRKEQGTTIRTNTTPTNATTPGVIDRLGKVGSDMMSQVSDSISGTGKYEGQNPLTRGIAATEAVFSDVPKGVVALLPDTVRKPVEAVGSGISTAFKALTDLIGSNKQLQDWTLAHPEATQKIMEVAQGTADVGSIAGTIAGAEGAVSTASKIGNLTSKGANVVKSGVTNTADTALKTGTDLRKNIQTYIGNKNVNPQLRSSVERLTNVVPNTHGVKGAVRLENPVQTYNKYLEQSKKALTDLHVDPAISEVGSKIGDAFSTVAKQRQAVGKTIGEELKTVGKVRVPAIEPRTTLLSQLKESGLAYNPKTKKLTSFSGSKFAPEEVKMLQSYVDGFNKLGDNPTVSQIDNFISQKRTQLEFAKGASGVVGTTNAERIIKGNLAGLRETLNPAKNGNKSLSNYWKANDTYSQLSDFLEEGQGFLGKKTQSGDYAKDASIAKSSVQSILNGGKKDWLLKLEGLTGYQALDNAVLALQAMKDAGDFRGLSLLQILSEGAVPTSKAGFTQKAIDFAVAKGGQAVAGTPEEQTRAFLNALKQQSQSTSQVVK